MEQEDYLQEIQERDNQVHKQPQSNMALASLVVGIIAIVTSCCFYGGVVFGGLGILFALLSKTEDKFEKYAKAGLITSSIALVLVVILIVLVLLLSLSGNFRLGGAF